MRLVLSLLSLAATAGIASASHAAPGPGQAQAATGKALYAGQCAMCHGAAMQGGAGPALKTAAALTRPIKGPKISAADLELWNRQNMPQTAPGTLTKPDSLAIVAYILRTNGLYGAAEPLTAANASKVRLK